MGHLQAGLQICALAADEGGQALGLLNLVLQLGLGFQASFLVQLPLKQVQRLCPCCHLLPTYCC